MRISAKGKYAVKMLVDLAENNGEDFISLSDIAERKNISKKFLEQIVPIFVKAGIVRANRGNRGGYRLNKPACMCTIGEVLRATDGELLPVDDAVYDSDASVQFIWEGLHDTVCNYVDRISLQDIIERKNEFYDYII